MILFLLLIGCFQAEANVILCQNEHDYYKLLYNICIQALPCKSLYHLYPLSGQSVNQIINTPNKEAFIDYRNERDYDLFVQQLTRSLIFRFNGSMVELERRLVLQGLVPEAWLPTTIIRFGGEEVPPCFNATIELSDIISALYSLHIYKISIADEFFCHDPNERFFLNPLSNKSICRCKPGKLCDNNSFFNYLMVQLSSILITGIAATIVTLFIIIFYKHYLLNNA